MLPDCGGDLQDFLVRGAVDINGHRLLPVVAQAQVGVREPIPHGGDITQADRRAIQPRQDDDVLEIALFVVPAERTDEDLLFTR